MAKRTFPRLAMAAEIQEVTGLSRQRVLELSKTDWRFPDPVARLKVGDVYLWDEIAAYAALPRKSGRPASPK